MVTKAKDHSEFQYWCPRVQKNKKWKSSHGKWELPANGWSALGWQFGQHVTQELVTPISHMGGFSFLVFLNPWASILKFWMVFCFGYHFLFNSILAGCVYSKQIKFTEKGWHKLTKPKFITISLSFLARGTLHYFENKHHL